MVAGPPGEKGDLVLVSMGITVDKLLCGSTSDEGRGSFESPIVKRTAPHRT